MGSDARAADALAPLDYEAPRVLTGMIYAKESEPRQPLFSFRRTSVRTGTRVGVLREYHTPDGTLAARERVTYEGSQLVSFELEDLRSGDKGKAVWPPASGGRGDRLRFEFAAGGHAAATDEEKLRPDTLVSDMLPGFMVAHWTNLIAGTHVKFRFVALARMETVGFELLKDGETTLRDQPVVRLRMEPSSVVIARFVEPLYFLVEPGGAHRILEYTGRTTPRVKAGKQWQDLDARTVFGWE
jgi:hypothetical protein